MRLFALYVFDIILFCTATVLAFLLEHKFSVPAAAVPPFTSYLARSVVFAALTFAIAKTYRGIWKFTSIEDVLILVTASTGALAASIASSFYIDALDGIPGSLPVIQMLLVMTLMTGVRGASRTWHLSRQNRHVHRPEPTLVIGHSDLTDLDLQRMRRPAHGTISICGLLLPDKQQTGRSIYGHPILGTPENAGAIIDDLALHGVIVTRVAMAVPITSLSNSARATLRSLPSTRNVRLDVGPEAPISNEHLCGPDTATTEDGTAQSKGSPVDASTQDRRATDSMPSGTYWSAKRVLDVVIAVPLMIVCLPLMAIVAAIVAIDLGAPILFWQQRPGRGGRPFRVYKFRTMSAPFDTFGQRNPDTQRVSPVGQFLRRTRLDELPQLFNIVTGEMSFIGPRPLLASDQPADSIRLLVRPGLTGWAQVNGGRALNVDDKCALDRWYIRNASFAVDTRIMAATLALVLRGERRNATAIRIAHRCDERAVSNDQPHGFGAGA